jgi:hypothetical protein
VIALVMCSSGPAIRRAGSEWGCDALNAYGFPHGAVRVGEAPALRVPATTALGMPIEMDIRQMATTDRLRDSPVGFMVGLSGFR